jgi:hypothetical protein
MGKLSQPMVFCERGHSWAALSKKWTEYFLTGACGVYCSSADFPDLELPENGVQHLRNIEKRFRAHTKNLPACTSI